MSFSGEVYVYQQLTKITKGSYVVPQNLLQVQLFLNKFIQPPVADVPVKTERKPVVERELREIGFPKLCKENVRLCRSCHW